MLSDWPLAEPRNWLDLVNQPQIEAEVSAIRRCFLRGCPYGDSNWVQSTAVSLGLKCTLRPRDRLRIVQE
jgi:hypothetical protein